MIHSKRSLFIISKQTTHLKKVINIIILLSHEFDILYFGISKEHKKLNNKTETVKK